MLFDMEQTNAPRFLRLFRKKGQECFRISWPCIQLMETRLVATWELKRGNTGAPLEATRGGDVLVGVPECAIIHGVNRDAGIVAPAVAGALLRASSGDDLLRGLHRAFVVGRDPAHIPHAG